MHRSLSEWIVLNPPESCYNLPEKTVSVPVCFLNRFLVLQDNHTFCTLNNIQVFGSNYIHLQHFDQFECAVSFIVEFPYTKSDPALAFSFLIHFMKFKSIGPCNFQWSSYENGDAGCSLLSDHLWREPRLNTSSNRKFSDLFQIFIVQFGESIHRSVQEPRTAVRTYSNITSFSRNSGCPSPCSVFPFLFSSSIQTARRRKASAFSISAVETRTFHSLVRNLALRHHGRGHRSVTLSSNLIG
jgi:hypothetical protein